MYSTMPDVQFQITLLLQSYQLQRFIKIHTSVQQKVFFLLVILHETPDQKNPLCGEGGFSWQILQEAAKNLINTAFRDGLNMVSEVSPQYL